MKKKFLIFMFIGILLISCSCTRESDSLSKGKEKASKTIADISIAYSPDGVVLLPDTVSPVIKNVFSKYTKILAPNGKPIHILAQSGVSDGQMVRARNILTHFLTDYPGSVYGRDKASVANSMANRNAALGYFNSEEAAEQAFQSGIDEKIDLRIQDLYATESPVEGSEDYMNHITRDASFEEILHLVHDQGITPALPDYQDEIQAANDEALKKGFWIPWGPPYGDGDLPEVDFDQEYFACIFDNYIDLWAVKPKKDKGRNVRPFPERTSHYGHFKANSRKMLLDKDPAGVRLLEKYFHPYLTYNARLPESFRGAFSLELDPSKPYTYKSQHLKDATLSGKNNAKLTGNSLDNVLTGNDGDNFLIGGGGEDRLDGGKGKDTAVFTGVFADYVITIDNGKITVIDKISKHDGKDVLKNIEYLKFKDRIIES